MPYNDDEWHGRESGCEKRAPPRPSLEEVLRLVDGAERVERRIETGSRRLSCPCCKSRSFPRHFSVPGSGMTPTE